MKQPSDRLKLIALGLVALIGVATGAPRIVAAVALTNLGYLRLNRAMAAPNATGVNGIVASYVLADTANPPVSAPAAGADFERALQLDPSYGPARAGLVLADGTAGESDAKQCCDPAGEPVAQLVLGARAYASGDPGGAVRDWTLAGAAPYFASWAEHWLGTGWGTITCRQASTYSKLGLDIDPIRPDSLFDDGMSRWCLNDLAGAENDFTAAATRYPPGSERASLSAGEAASLGGRWNEAAGAFRAAIASPVSYEYTFDRSNALQGLAKTQAHLGDWTAAQSTMDLLTRDGSFPYAFIDVGDIALTGGDLNRARTWYAKVGPIARNDPAAATALALAYNRLGDAERRNLAWDAALQDYQQALAWDSSLSFVQKNLAAVQQQLKSANSGVSK
jgi:tetratricopeptide (TPR) repeat protein